MATSPTQRTLAECKRRGWPATVVERWNQWAKVRQDLFGGLDILALTAEDGVLGIQATSDSNLASRVTKIQALVNEAGPLRTWLERTNRIEVWGWKKVETRWRVRIVSIRLHALGGALAVPEAA